MSMKIAIIGGGWYGCHIAATLDALNFDVTLFEQHHRLLHEASGNNQFRLHLGFHYARDYRTRLQSRDGYQRFLERYEHLTESVKYNYYIVPKDDSVLDFMTYKIIMLTSGIEFDEIHAPPRYLRHVKGMINTNERKIMTQKARDYFGEILGDKIHLDTKIDHVEIFSDGVKIGQEQYDFLIDATWGHFDKRHEHFFYEPTLLLYYKTEEIDFPALTYVDGPLCSLYPTENEGVYTLSSVPITPLGRFENADDARKFLANITEETIQVKRLAMEEQIKKYLPDFSLRFTYQSPQLAIKTKPIGQNDDRSCYVEQNGRKISIMSGKIDTVFYASQQILKIIEKHKHK